MWEPATEDYAEAAIELSSLGMLLLSHDTLYGFACDAWLVGDEEPFFVFDEPGEKDFSVSRPETENLSPLGRRQRSSDHSTLFLDIHGSRGKGASGNRGFRFEIAWRPGWKRCWIGWLMAETMACEESLTWIK
nr:uncharacterized protein LOC109174928 [Ipomoea batatas]